MSNSLYSVNTPKFQNSFKKSEETRTQKSYSAAIISKESSHKALWEITKLYGHTWQWHLPLPCHHYQKINRKDKVVKARENPLGSVQKQCQQTWIRIENLPTSQKNCPIIILLIIFSFCKIIEEEIDRIKLSIAVVK